MKLIHWLLLIYIGFSKSSTPSCKRCKFFIPSKMGDHLGLCSMFPTSVYNKKNEVKLKKNLAIYNRSDENLCGKAGYLYEPIENNSYENYINNLYLNDFAEKFDLEQLKNIYEIFQKLKEHNLHP